MHSPEKENPRLPNTLAANESPRGVEDLIEGIQGSTTTEYPAIRRTEDINAQESLDTKLLEPAEKSAAMLEAEKSLALMLEALAIDKYKESQAGKEAAQAVKEAAQAGKEAAQAVKEAAQAQALLLIFEETKLVHKKSLARGEGETESLVRGAVEKEAREAIEAMLTIKTKTEETTVRKLIEDLLAQLVNKILDSTHQAQLPKALVTTKSELLPYQLHRALHPKAERFPKALAFEDGGEQGAIIAPDSKILSILSKNYPYFFVSLPLLGLGKISLNLACKPFNQGILSFVFTDKYDTSVITFLNVDISLQHKSDTTILVIKTQENLHQVLQPLIAQGLDITIVPLILEQLSLQTLLPKILQNPKVLVLEATVIPQAKEVQEAVALVDILQITSALENVQVDKTLDLFNAPQSVGENQQASKAPKLIWAWVAAIPATKYLLTEYIPVAHYAKDLSVVKYLAQYENSLLDVAYVATNLKHVLDNLDYYKLKPIHLLNPFSSSALFLTKPYIYQYRDAFISSCSKDSQYATPIKIISYIATDVALSLALQGPTIQAFLGGATIGSINYHNSQQHPDSNKLSTSVAFATTTLVLYKCYKTTQRTDALSIPLVYIPIAASTHVYSKYLVDTSMDVWNSFSSFWKASPTSSTSTETNGLEQKTINITYITKILDYAMLYKILFPTQDESFICVTYSDYEKNLSDEENLVNPTVFLNTIKEKLKYKVPVLLHNNVSQCLEQDNFFICMGKNLLQDTSSNISSSITQILLIEDSYTSAGKGLIKIANDACIDDPHQDGCTIERICFQIEHVAKDSIIGFEL